MRSLDREIKYFTLSQRKNLPRVSIPPLIFKQKILRTQILFKETPNTNS